MSDPASLHRSERSEVRAAGPEPEIRPRPPRLDQIVTAARDLLETAGPEALTMRAVADALGIQAPSLYKHVRNKAALELALVSDALWQIGRVTHDAADRGVAALTAAYRQEARRQPNLYRLATQGTLARDQLQPGLEEWAGNPWFRVTGDAALAQALWSFAHGMVILELDGRYPPGSDLAATWAAGVRAFTRS